MVKDIEHLLKENEQLIHEKEELTIKLRAANEIIEAIKQGNIDAVFIATNEMSNVLVSKTADQTYRRFIENMREGVLTLDTNGIILYSNSSFARIVHLPLEKVIGANFRDFIPAEYIEHFEGLLTEHPWENSKVELSIVNHTNKRKHFTVSFNTLPLRDFVALNLVWTDVTDQKEAEEKLMTVNENLTTAIEERISSAHEVVILNDKLKENIKILKDANAELATFAHIASHDLQEPTRKIITYSELLRSEYYNNIDLRGQGYIDKVQRASSRMRNLINDILEYSQLSQTGIVFGPTSLQSVFNEIFYDFEIVIKETKAKITIVKDLPVIEANSSQMRQLFQNLISNSLKFIKAGSIPEISIAYENITGKEIGDASVIEPGMGDEMFCRLHIKDNGIGFNQVYANKIFTIFQRLNNTSVYQGTGIGLAICKKIVEKHKGLITAESMLNEGAIFTITLPFRQVERSTPWQKDVSTNGH